MRNQLRAGFYLLVRNPCVWAALALVVVRWAWCVARVAEGGMSFGLQDSIFRDEITLLAYPFVGAGVAAFDQRDGALRGVCAAEAGRARYVASRFVMVAVAVLALVAASAALDLLGGVLVPGASRIMASPQMHGPVRLAAGVLTALFAGELTFLLGTLTRSRSALATMGTLALVLLLAYLAGVLLIHGGEASSRLVALLAALAPLAGLSADVAFPPAASLVPPDLVHALVTPLVWLAALFALARLLMARRTV